MAGQQEGIQIRKPSVVQMTNIDRALQTVEKASLEIRKTLGERSIATTELRLKQLALDIEYAREQLR